MVEEKSIPTVQPKPEKTPVKDDNKTVVKNKKQENRGLTIIGIIAMAIAVIAVVWLWIPQNTNNVSLVSEPTTTEIVDPQPTIAPNNNQNSQTNKIPGQSEDSLVGTVVAAAVRHCPNIACVHWSSILDCYLANQADRINCRLRSRFV